MSELTDQQMATIKDAAKKLTGAKRRAFQAQVVLDYLDGSARRAETVFGWSRRTVILGLNERRSGIRCLEHFSARGNRTTEAKRPQLAEDIRCLAEPESQVDPKFQSPFRYTRMTAHAMRQALVDKKGWKEDARSRERGDFRTCASGESSLGRARGFRADFDRYQGQSECWGILPRWKSSRGGGDESPRS